jgi:hypothetical protein
MSLEMAQKVIVPQKKDYVPQFLKQRDINSYYVPLTFIMSLQNSCLFSITPGFFGASDSLGVKRSRNAH